MPGGKTGVPRKCATQSGKASAAQIPASRKNGRNANCRTGGPKAALRFSSEMTSWVFWDLIAGFSKPEFPVARYNARGKYGKPRRLKSAVSLIAGFLTQEMQPLDHLPKRMRNSNFLLLLRLFHLALINQKCLHQRGCLNVVS